MWPLRFYSDLCSKLFNYIYYGYIGLLCLVFVQLIHISLSNIIRFLLDDFYILFYFQILPRSFVGYT